MGSLEYQVRVESFKSIQWIYIKDFTLCAELKIHGYKKIEALRSHSTGRSLYRFCSCDRCQEWSRLGTLLGTFGKRISGLWFGNNNLKVMCELTQNREDLGNTFSNVSPPNFISVISEKDIFLKKKRKNATLCLQVVWRTNLSRTKLFFPQESEVSVLISFMWSYFRHGAVTEWFISLICTTAFTNEGRGMVPDCESTNVLPSQEIISASQDHSKRK